MKKKRETDENQREGKKDIKERGHKKEEGERAGGGEGEGEGERGGGGGGEGREEDKGI